jgi:hypothetical protein
MGNLTIATIFIVMANVLMFMVGVAMADVNPNGTMCQSKEGSIIQESIYSSTNYSVVKNNVLGDLPKQQNSPVSSEGTTITFTDVFNSVVGWFTEKTGLKYAYDVVAAPYNILNCMGLPTDFIAAVGTLWYVVSLLILVSYFWGGRE